MQRALLNICVTWEEDVREVYDGDESQNVQELHHQVLHQVPIILV